MAAPRAARCGIPSNLRGLAHRDESAPAGEWCRRVKEWCTGWQARNTYASPMPGPGSLLAWLSITILHLDGWQVTYQTRRRACVRYNFNPRHSMAIACSYMRVSNLYLSLTQVGRPWNERLRSRGWIQQAVRQAKKKMRELVTMRCRVGHNCTRTPKRVMSSAA
jgi:hypothetical protein